MAGTAVTSSSRSYGNRLYIPDGAVSNQRQVCKIVHCYKNISGILGNDAPITGRDLDLFLREIAQKEIACCDLMEKTFRDFIARIKGNQLLCELPELFALIGGHRHLRAILAYFTHFSIFERDKVTVEDLNSFLGQFPDAYEFQNEARCFLEMIGAHNGTDKRREYEIAMTRFMEIVYGKQFEYLLQVNLLRHRAHEDYVPRMFREELSTLSVTPLAADKSEALSAAAQMKGDPYKNNVLTPEILRANGLEPAFCMSFQGKERAYFSRPYKLCRHRLAVTAYLRHEEEWVPRSYYLSNSHALWRYLEGYTMPGNRLLGYGTGNKRARTNLGLIFQRALSMLLEMAGAPLEVADDHFMFLGTASNVVARMYVGSDFYLKNQRPPQKLSGDFYRESVNDPLTDPQRLQFHDPQQAPDPDKTLLIWRSANGIYGTVDYHACLSKNHTFIYTICTDGFGRKWIANIENHTPVNDLGVKQRWIDGGDLMTPAYEYIGKAGDYGNPEWVCDAYIDMYQNYISKIPLFS